VDQITLRSGHQLQPPKSARKEKEEVIALKELPTSENAREQNGEEALLSSSNSKSVTREKELTEDPKKDLPVPVPFQVCQGSHKDMVRYDVISHLKRIPTRLSVFNALQMSKELRRAVIQVLMDPDD